ncbi:MAG: hypothetical protein GWP04_06655 [Gammaproteobacteria bacterium]|nr:hypothetical protein [Gammaproteobacteria bacterium]
MATARFLVRFAVMLWLALVLFIAMTVALLRGGRLINLADIRLRFWWLLLLGFGIQAATGFLPAEEAWTRPTATTMILVSYLPLLILVLINRQREGMWLAGLGILMNFSVIALNGGMPVLEGAAAVAGGLSEGSGAMALALDFKHVVLDASTRLPFLADVMPVRLFGTGQVISLGDVLLAVGLGRFLEDELRKPVRWFKRGIHTEGGSASHR